MFTRICAVAIAALGLAGCASYQQYPNEAYGYPNEAYGYGTYPTYGYGTYPAYGGAYYGNAWPWRGDYGHYSEGEFDDFYRHHQDDDRFVRPANGVICDRARDVCYDRHGIANHATKDVFGDHADRDSHRNDDKRRDLYSPRPGVICDRRSNDCWKGNWPDSQGDVMTRQRYNEKLQSDASPSGRDRHLEQRFSANSKQRTPADEARPYQQPQYWPPAPEKKSRKESNATPLAQQMEMAKPHADSSQSQPLLRQQRVNEKRASGKAACPPNGCADD